MKSLARWRVMATIFLAVALACTVGCTQLTGVPSFTLLARDLPPGSSLKPVGPVVEESECMRWILLLITAGENPTHESVVARCLEKHGADALLNAEVESSAYGVPYIYMEFRTTVRGQPAVLAGGGAR